MHAFLLVLSANLATYALWLMVVTMRGELHKRGLFDVWVPLGVKPSGGVNVTMYLGVAWSYD
jgi:hypothetical protein